MYPSTSCQHSFFVGSFVLPRKAFIYVSHVVPSMYV